MKKRVSTCIILLLLCGCSDNKSESTTETTTEIINYANVHMGVVEADTLDASTMNISESDYDTINIVDSYLKTDQELSLIKEAIDAQKSLPQNLLIHNAQKVYLSKKYICSYGCAEQGFPDLIRYYLFDSDNNELGYVLLGLSPDSDIFASAVLFTNEAVDSDLLRVYKDMPDTKYIALINGTKYLFIDENNALTSLSYGDSIEIVGDVYHKFDTEKIAVSYNEIIDDNEWVEISLQ